jgi:hypothetical protein
MDEAVDRAIAALAKRQHGYVKRAQLLSLGLSRQAIGRRIKAGRLIPVYAGVYAVGHTPTHPLERAHGALLACGPGAVLSHGSAATVWSISKHWQMPFEVTTPGVRRRHGITTHRAVLRRDDVTRNLGIRCTSTARTLLDIAPRLTAKQLTRAVNDLRHAHHLRLEQLAELLERYPRHRGAPLLRPFVAHRRGPTRSGIEDAFLEFTRRYGLPEPLINVKVNGREVDAFFPVERVIVELDSWGFHSDRDTFEGDRDRDAAMLEVDLPTVRITWERLTETAEREAKRLHAILEMRRQRAA